MTFLITFVAAAACVTPSWGGAAPLQGPLGVSRAVPFETRSFGAVPVARPVPAQLYGTAHKWEKQSAFLPSQAVVHTVPSSRRSNSLLTARAEGVGAPGFPKDLAVCPGSNRKTCNENDIHRVCVQLLQGEGMGPITWGIDSDANLLDYFFLTGKESFRSEWWKQMTDRNGDSRCIGMDSTSMLIDKVGCDKVNIRCDATDLAFVELTVQPRTPGLKTLEPIKQCIKQKCAKPALAEADVQKESTVIRLMGIMTAVCLSAFAAGALRRRATVVQVESLLG